MQVAPLLHSLRPSRLGYRASSLTGLGAVATPVTPQLGPQMCANPLPPGRYAITLSDSPVGSARAFQIWADNNSSAVTIEASESMGADTEALVAIFTLSKPVMWSPTIWGCPNVAGDTIKTPKDAQPALSPSASSNPLSTLFPSWFGGKPGGGAPTWLYLSLGAVVLVALAPMMFEVTKVVAIREEHKT